jgi:hypothetical protein
MVPASMSILDLLQFLALLFSDNGRHLLVPFGHYLVDAPAGIAPHLLELCSGFIDDWRNFGDLFRRQIKLSLQPFPHSLADHCAVMSHEEKMPRVRCPHESARHATGEKNQEETGDQFPPQRAIHCENSAWIAESAIAYSLVNESPISRLCLASRIAPIVDTMMTAADNSATCRSKGVKPFTVFVPARQSATTRVSNPKGITAAPSSPPRAADRSNRSIFRSFITFPSLKFSRAVVSFFAGLETRAL